MKASGQYFPVVLFIVLYRVAYSLFKIVCNQEKVYKKYSFLIRSVYSVLLKLLDLLFGSGSHSNKSFEKYFLMGLFIMQSNHWLQRLCVSVVSTNVHSNDFYLYFKSKN